MLESTTGPADQPAPSVVVAEPDAKFVVVPDAALLFTADYKRSGPDLVLTGQDGRHTVVQDYFKTDNPLKLMAPNGASLQADVVDLLAGAHSHHQYAQAGDAPTPPAPIATVKALMGSASVVRNGAEVTLKIGDPIYKSDIIQTASGSSVGITFPDGTALHITANARMALSDYSFDANSTTNGAFFHLIDGTFSFVAGQVARTGGLKIETPVGTVGIRGTTGWVQQVATVSATLGNTSYSFAVVQDQNSDHTGIYDVLDSNGNIIATISQSGVLTMISGQGVGQALLVNTQQLTDAQLAFEQQIIQAVFNLATGLTPRLDPGHDGSYPTPPYEQHNELPGDHTTTFAFTLPGVDDKEFVALAKVVWTPPVLPVFQTTGADLTNHAPTLDPGTVASIPTNDRTSAGESIATIFAGKFHDADAGASLAGIAVAGNTANARTQGVWQYSSNGVWIDIGSVSASAALVLGAGTLLRFVPVHNFYGEPPPLVVYGIDNSYAGGFSNGLIQIEINATVGGGSTPLSATPVEITTSVGANVWINTSDGGAPVGGDWGIGGHWTEGVPGPPQVVIIDLPRGETVHFNGGGRPVSTTIAELQNLGHGTLDVSHKATLKVQGPATNEGRIEATDHGRVSFKFGQVDNKECAVIEAAGRGSLVDFSYSLVRNAGLIAAFSQGSVTFDHVVLKNTYDGAIKADGWGSEIDFNNTLITSAGLIEAKHDGFITFDRVFLHNGADGVIEAQGRGSEIDFSHSNVANGGLIEARSGGVVSFHGGTVDNTHHGANDGGIEAIGRGSVVELHGTHVIGGTLQTSGHGVIEVESSGTVFDGSQTDCYGCVMAVTIDGYVLIDENSDLTLLGTIHNHGLIEVDTATSAASQLMIHGSVTLDGCGYVELDGRYDSIIGSSGHGNVLENVDNTIYGAGSIGDGSGLKLINDSDGVIDANVRHGTLTIDTGWHHIVNDGLLEATHGGNLVIDSDVSNDCGFVEAGRGSHVTLAGDIFGGHALIDGGTLEYDGASNVSTEFACNTAGTLVLGACSDFCGTVSGFGAGDILDFKGIGFSNCTDLIYCAGDGTLTVSDGSGNSSTVHLTGSYDPSDFAVFNDGTGHAAVAEPPQANDDIVIASDSALDDCNHLTIRSDALLANDSNPIPGDTISLESVSGRHASLDGDGNVSDGIYGSTASFCYTLDDEHGLQSTANVQVSVQCGSLNGTCANEIILPGSENACLTGGGGNDTFLFQSNVSTDQYAITDFTTHSQGGGADTITLDDFACIQDFHDVLDHAHDCGGSTVIDLGLCNTITIQNVNVCDLSAADFTIHHASGGGGGGNP